MGGCCSRMRRTWSVLRMVMSTTSRFIGRWRIRRRQRSIPRRATSISGVEIEGDAIENKRRVHVGGTAGGDRSDRDSRGDVIAGHQSRQKQSATNDVPKRFAANQLVVAAVH